MHAIVVHTLCHHACPDNGNMFIQSVNGGPKTRALLERITDTPIRFLYDYDPYEI